RAGSTDDGSSRLSAHEDAGTRVAEGAIPFNIGANATIKDGNVGGIADDGDAVAAIGRNDDLGNDRMLEAADRVVMGTAVDEDTIGAVAQGQHPIRVQAD